MIQTNVESLKAKQFFFKIVFIHHDKYIVILFVYRVSPKSLPVKLEFELHVTVPCVVPSPPDTSMTPTFKRIQVRQSSSSNLGGCPRQLGNPVVLSACHHAPNEPLFFKAAGINDLEQPPNIDLKLCCYAQNVKTESNANRV